jgi:hypothetical protein
MARGRTNVALALYRRLITPRGTLQGGDEEAAYGIDLTDYIGAVGTDNAIAMLPSVVAAELRKDDRVESVSAVATATQEAAGLVSIMLVISVQLVDDDESFDLTIGVSSVGVELLGGLP